MALREKLEAEIVEQIGELNRITVGSDDYKIAAEGVAKLLEQYNKLSANMQASESLELEKIKVEYDMVKANRTADIEQDKLKETKKGRWTTVATVLFTTATSAGLYIWGVNSNFKFEEFCTTTTNIGKQIVSKVTSWLTKIK